MPKGIQWTILAACLASSGCLTGFKHPLGPAREGFIEARLLGTWDCRSTDDPKPGRFTFMDFDGKQYYVQVTEKEEGKPGHFRGFATRVEDMPFLNLRGIGPTAEAEWTLLAYSLEGGDRLHLRIVDPDPFEDVIDDATTVRDRLAARLQDPEVIRDLLSCTRAAEPRQGETSANER